MTAEAPYPLEFPEMVEPRRRTFAIRTDDGPGEIAAIELGDPARPIDLVFLHANGFNALTYRAMLSPLAAGLRILAIDQEGHGRSPQRRPDERPNGWLDFRDDLVALLDQLDGPPLVLAGHSMGGAVGILAAAERPAAVRGLALLDPVVLPERIAREAMAGGGQAFADSALAIGARRRRARFASLAEAAEAYRGRGAFKTWPDQALHDYITDGFRPMADGGVELTCSPAWEAGNFSKPAHDIWGALRAAPIPTAILRAQHGSTCAIKSADAFAVDGRAFDVATIEDSTHFLPIERPALARDLILRIVGSLSAA